MLRNDLDLQRTALNFVLLGLFTLLESIALGVAVSFYDKTVVLQALLVDTIPDCLVCSDVFV